MNASCHPQAVYSAADALVASLGAGPMLVGVYDASDVLVYANAAFQEVFALEDALGEGQAPLTFADVVLRGVACGRGVRIDRGDQMAFVADAQARRRERPGQRCFATDLMDGRWYWMTETLLANGWVTVLGAEITTLKRGEDELKRARDAALVDSRTDVLTGVPNRRHTLELLDIALHTFARPEAPVSLALIDLDGFKQINDRYGHGAGDAVLTNFARVARRLVRRQDTVGRIGGEEFLIVMPGAPADEAFRVMEMLRRGVAMQCVRSPAGDDVRYTFSAGVTEARANDNATSVLKRADDTLYRAKRLGRNRNERA